MRDISTESLGRFVTCAKHSSNKLHMDGAEGVEARQDMTVASNARQVARRFLETVFVRSEIHFNR